MSSRSVVEPPDWFRVSEYAYTKDLDAAEWFRALSIRRRYDSLHRESQQREDTLHPDVLAEFPFDRECFWKNFREVTSPDALENSEAKALEDRDEQISAESHGTDSHRPEHIKPIEEISEDTLRDNEKVQALADYDLNVEGKVLLVVDRETPDPALIEAFKAWLISDRVQHPLPVSRRGRKALNVQITNEHLSRWRKYQVLAVFDLDFWTQIFGLPRISHSNLCGFVAPKREDLQNKKEDPQSKKDMTDPKEWGREASKALREALSSIDMLAHQVLGGEK